MVDRAGEMVTACCPPIASRSSGPFPLRRTTRGSSSGRSRRRRPARSNVNVTSSRCSTAAPGTSTRSPMRSSEPRCSAGRTRAAGARCTPLRSVPRRGRWTTGADAHVAPRVRCVHRRRARRDADRGRHDGGTGAVRRGGLIADAQRDVPGGHGRSRVHDRDGARRAFRCRGPGRRAATRVPATCHGRRGPDGDRAARRRDLDELLERILLATTGTCTGTGRRATAATICCRCSSRPRSCCR